MSADRAKDRAKGLERIARVQAQMVRLAELRQAAADGRIRALGEDRAALVDYVAGTNALGVPLAKAALRSIEALDRRRAEAERARAAEAARLDTLRRRDRAVATMAEAAARDARRAAEAAELAAIMDAWLTAREGGSTGFEQSGGVANHPKVSLPTARR